MSELKSDKKSSGLDSKLNIKYNLLSKIKYLQEIRHEIKKKRILLDENKDRFGLDEMSQLVKVKNTSEVKGYPFKAHKDELFSKTKGIKFGIKIVPIETKYEKYEHPCNLENLVLKDLTDNIILKNISPHITFYLGVQKVSNKSRSIKMLNLKRLEVEEKIRSHSNMLISEFVESGSLDNWVFNTYENDEEISDEQWKYITFQLIYTIAIMQHYYKMMHNDFHYGNILIDTSIEPVGYLVYQVNNKTYYLKNTGVIPKAWDLEFSMVYSNKIPDCYPNKFITGPYTYDKKLHKTIVSEKEKLEEEGDESFNVPYNYNEVYDLHYFLTSLLDLYISQDLFDWILKLYPSELIPEDDSTTNSGTTTTDSKSSISSTTFTATLSDTSSIVDTDTTNTTNTTDTNDTTDNSTHTENEPVKKYLSEGRLINGIENEFKLPNPIDLLNDPFFECLTIKPSDFNENEAIYFKAGF